MRIWSKLKTLVSLCYIPAKGTGTRFADVGVKLTARDGRYRMTATDRIVLLEVTGDCERFETLDVVIPPALLVAVDGDELEVEQDRSGPASIVSVNETRAESVAGRFPTLDDLMPRGNPILHCVRVDINVLLRILNAMKQLTVKGERDVVMEFGDKERPFVIRGENVPKGLKLTALVTPLNPPKQGTSKCN